MKDHRPSIGAHLHVDLDGKAALNRCLDRAERIFRASLVMESPVRNWRGDEPVGSGHF